MSRRVLVLGSGATGRCISTALAADSAIECVIGVSQPGAERAFAESIGVGAVAVDMENAASVRDALDGVFAVVNAGGPFQPNNYQMARQCAKHSVHYVDMAGTRKYVAGITALNRQAEAGGCLIVAGATSVPAISAALVDSLVHEFDRVTEIHTAISPVDEKRPWFATVHAMLSYVGRPMRIKQMGRWRDAFGWSEPEMVVFPAPVGRRRVYLCDVPDLDLFPRWYGVQTVTFRVGVGQVLLNYTLAGLSRLRHRSEVVEENRRNRDACKYCHGFQRLLDMTASIRVRVCGQRNEADVARAACLIARTDSGGVIACSPVIALIKEWVHEGINRAGAVPCIGLLSLEAIKAELLHHDVVLVRS